MTVQPWVIPHRDATDTELAAAAKAEAAYPGRAAAVLEFIASREDGVIDHEGCAAMNMIKDSYAPARHALVRMGYVRDSGERRRNERGNSCIVWTVTGYGLVALRDGTL